MTPGARGGMSRRPERWLSRAQSAIAAARPAMRPEKVASPTEMPLE